MVRPKSWYINFGKIKVRSILHSVYFSANLFISDKSQYVIDLSPKKIYRWSMYREFGVLPKPAKSIENDSVVYTSKLITPSSLHISRLHTT